MNVLRRGFGYFQIFFKSKQCECEVMMKKRIQIVNVMWRGGYGELKIKL